MAVAYGRPLGRRGGGLGVVCAEVTSSFIAQVYAHFRQGAAVMKVIKARMAH